MPTWTSLGARFWISILGFWDPSSCRTPGAALERPDFEAAVAGEFWGRLDGESIAWDEKGSDGSGLGADGFDGIGVPRVAIGGGTFEFGDEFVVGDD